MTSVICWFDHSPETPHAPWPWAIADSRFSYPSDSSDRQVLIDRGVKIFSFPLIIQDGWKGGKLHHFANIGLVFAGSTLIAHNTMLSVASICENLSYRAAPESERKFSLNDVATLTATLATRFAQELVVVRGANALTEFALIGWCPEQQKWRIFHLAPTFNPEFHITSREFLPKKYEEILVLGDHKSQVQQEVSKIRAKISQKDLTWWRAPAKALRNLIDREDLESIGGFIQVGSVIQAVNSFQLAAVLEPPEQLQQTFRYLGMDSGYHEVAVGPCYINFRAIPV